MKILLLEDDLIFNEIIKEYLESLNYIVVQTYTGEEAEELIYTYKYDLLILDIHVPIISGIDLLNDFRKSGYTTPAIFVTSVTNTDQISKAFEIGADDFIKKPFSFSELDSRINYIKKMYSIDTNNYIRINEIISFDVRNMSIIKDKKHIKIPKKEAEIIKYFLLNTNRTISIDELIVNLWNFEHEPSISTIRSYIKNIRKSISKSCIETIKGLGYKFNTY